MAYHQPQQQQLFPAQYGYCDSYFVEAHDQDDGLFAKAAAERERHEQISRIRQKALAQELSDATAEEYRDDVLDHMERMELQTMPDIHSIEIQTEIQWFMRPYLLDFLLEAHQAFKLLPETLHLAVNLLDRYCSRRVVYKRHYQLVGCAALLIAAKYGDRKERVPTIRELKLMCCSLYDDDMFTQMEWHVLQTLGWIIGHPTVTSFHQIAMADSGDDAELEFMAAYFSEIALYHKEFISIRSSLLARSSLALARCVLGRQHPHFNQWSSQYDPQVALNLSNILTSPSPALVRKYSAPAFRDVAGVVELFLQRQVLLAQQAAQVPCIATSWSELQPAHSAPNPQYLAPSTPQKGSYAPPVMGIITPPITPDKDMRHQDQDCIMGATNIRAPMPVVLTPSTPTPPPSVDHYQHQHLPQQQMPHHYMMQSQQHYMPQPQFAI